MRSGWQSSRAALFLWGMASLVAPGAAADGLLIRVPERRDHVFDPQGRILYISTGSGTVERFDLGSGQLLAPFTVGGFLLGLDVTADGRALYVADAIPGETQGFVRKVDTATGAVTDMGPCDGARVARALGIAPAEVIPLLARRPASSLLRNRAGPQQTRA